VNPDKPSVGAKFDVLSTRLNVLAWFHAVAAGLTVLVFVPSLKFVDILPRVRPRGAGLVYVLLGLFVCWPYIGSWLVSKDFVSNQPRGFARYIVGFVLISAAGCSFLAFVPDELRTMRNLFLATLVQFAAFKVLAAYLESFEYQ
jgi:hypothetical protein